MIYLCSPYSSANPDIKEQRYREALRCAAHYTNLGHVIFSPIVHHHPMAVHHEMPGTWDFWQKIDSDYVAIAKAVWVLTIDGWKESTGVQAEIELAWSLGKHVSYIVARPDGTFAIN